MNFTNILLNNYTKIINDLFYSKLNKKVKISSHNSSGTFAKSAWNSKNLTGRIANLNLIDCDYENDEHHLSYELNILDDLEEDMQKLDTF